MNEIAGPWIPGLSAAICGSCAGIFDSARGGCPKGDSGENGWHPVNHNRGRDEIRRLRRELEDAQDRLVVVKGGLLQIAFGVHPRMFFRSLATRMIAYINRGEVEMETPAVVMPAQERSLEQ